MKKKLFILATVLLPLLSGCAVPIIAAGVGGVALAADDRRSAGTQFDDKAIGIRATDLLNEKIGNQGHIVATSYNRQLLLTGQVPNEALREQAEQIARSIPNVKQVSNALTVGFSTSMATRTHDTYLTSAVKARMLGDRQYDAAHIKVITENGVVYLMGLVSRREAEAAATDAASTRGVEKVVKLFEYID